MRMKGDKKWKKSNQLNRTNECFCSILTQLQYLMTRRHCCWKAACFRSFFLMLITVVQVLIYTLIFLECEGNGLMTPPPPKSICKPWLMGLRGKKKSAEWYTSTHVLSSVVLCPSWLWWVDLGWLQDAHPAVPSLPSSKGHGEKIRWKILWTKIKTGRLLSCFWYKQGRLTRGKLI